MNFFVNASQTKRRIKKDGYIMTNCIVCLRITFNEWSIQLVFSPVTDDPGFDNNWGQRRLLYIVNNKMKLVNRTLLGFSSKSKLSRFPVISIFDHSFNPRVWYLQVDRNISLFLFTQDLTNGFIRTHDGCQTNVITLIDNDVVVNPSNCIIHINSFVGQSIERIAFVLFLNFYQDPINDGIEVWWVILGT